MGIQLVTEFDAKSAYLTQDWGGFRLGLSGPPHNGGESQKIPVILGGFSNVLGGVTPPHRLPPKMGGESTNMGGES